MSRPKTYCTIHDCTGENRGHGLCSKHYSRAKRHGDPHYLGRAESTKGVTQKVKREYVGALKLERGCTDCGYAAHPAALDFDHLPGTIKVRDIKQGQQLGWQALLNEIDKCEVVCANCHRIRTYERGGEVMSVDIQTLESDGR